MNDYKTEAEPKAWADGVPVYCAHDALADVAKLVPNPRNPNTHPDNQIQLLGRIIRQTGWRQPITVSTRSGFIVKGHGRLAAALLEGVKEVPVDYQNYASEAEEYADLVADNRIAELAEIDNKMLADIFAEIDTGEIPMELTGYTEEEIEHIVTGLAEALHEDELNEPDDVPELPEPEQVITQTGDIWILGRHRVICGDSTDRATVEKLMDGEKADLVFTDPPYGMKKEADGVHNDNLNYNDLLVFNKKWIPLTFEALKDNGSWYCWGIDEPLLDIYSEILRPMIKTCDIVFRNFIKWKKGDGVQNMLAPSGRSYSPMGESCLFVMCGVQGFNNNSDNYFEKYEPVRSYLEKEAIKAGLDAKKTKEICGVGMFSHWFTKSQWDLMTEANYRKIQSYCIENNINAFGVEYGEIKKEYDEIKKEYDEIKKEFYESRSYFDNTHEKMGDVWEFPPTNQEERLLAGGHATPKPIALCVRAIKSSSRESEIVLDVFGGSGSTLIACEQERRDCRMVELDPKWCDVIVRRYIKTTGKTTGIRLIRKGEELEREQYAGIFDD